ncbi:MAG: hypothetical protein CBB97_22660 [Candidatus Endolissoclinum sp. TMED37]|nr:MAG: hypothetical protein CBB97_22660 [Candidatus Endolissoclinum sp. TMED37]
MIIFIYMLNFCKYKDVLGKPKEGVHSIRFMNISVIDVLLTILLAIFIKTYMFNETEMSIILLGTFIIGIIIHRIFCVKTTIDKLLFESL